VTDAAAAQRALAKAASHQNDTPLVYRVAGGVAYLSDATSNIDDLIAATQKGSLAHDATYTAAAAQTGDGLAIVYVNGTHVPGTLTTAYHAAANPFASARVFVALKTTANGIIVTGHATGLPDLGLKTGKPSLVESAASDMLGELTVFDLGGELKAAASFGGAPLGFAGEALHEALGIDLEQDVIPWLRGETSVVVGGVIPPRVAVLIHPTDKAALARTLDAIATHLGSLTHARVTRVANGLDIQAQGGPPISVRQASDRIVIGTDAAYVASLLHRSPSPLSDDTVYRSAVGGSTSNLSSQIFVRVDRLRNLLGVVLQGNPEAEKVLSFLQPFEALAGRTTLSGHDADFSLTLSLAQ
jgi:hypothetical protein